MQSSLGIISMLTAVDGVKGEKHWGPQPLHCRWSRGTYHVIWKAGEPRENCFPKVKRQLNFNLVGGLVPNSV